MTSHPLVIIMQAASHVQLVGIPNLSASSACMGNNLRHRLSTLLHLRENGEKHFRFRVHVDVEIVGNSSKSGSTTCIHCRTKRCAPGQIISRRIQCTVLRTATPKHRTSNRQIQGQNEIMLQISKYEQSAHAIQKFFQKPPCTGA